MPIYEYRRPDGSTFEIMQSFSDDALTKDPETGVPVTRVLHAPAIHFKGSGFHNTDYGTRKRNAEKAAEKSASAEKSSAADSKSSSDSKSSEKKSSPDAGSSKKPESKSSDKKKSSTKAA